MIRSYQPRSNHLFIALEYEKCVSLQFVLFFTFRVKLIVSSMIAKRQGAFSTLPSLIVVVLDHTVFI